MPAAIHLDNFVDSDGTLLNAHTPDVGNAYITGILNPFGPVRAEINNNRVSQEDTDSAGWSPDVGGVLAVDDVEIRQTMIIDGTGVFNCFIIARFLSSFEEGYELLISGIPGDEIRFGLREFIAFGGTTIGTFDLTSVSFPVTLDIRFECFDSAKRVYVNEVLRIDASENNVAAAGDRLVEWDMSIGSPFNNCELECIEIIDPSLPDPITDEGLIHDVTQDMIDTVTRSVAA